MQGGSSDILLTPAQALGTYPRRVYMSHLHSRRKDRTINLIAEPTLYSINRNNPITPWISEDMMDKLRCLGPFVIYSDGSWSSKGDPWQHVMGNLPEHSGSIGLIFLSSSDDWRDRPVYALQIVNGEGLDAIAAFTMELFGILVSLAILSHFDTASTIYSDCEAAVKSLNNLATPENRSEQAPGTRTLSQLWLHTYSHRTPLSRGSKAIPRGPLRTQMSGPKSCGEITLRIERRQESSLLLRTTNMMDSSITLSLYHHFLH